VLSGQHRTVTVDVSGWTATTAPATVTILRRAAATANTTSTVGASRPTAASTPARHAATSAAPMPEIGATTTRPVATITGTVASATTEDIAPTRVQAVVLDTAAYTAVGIATITCSTF